MRTLEDIIKEDKELRRVIEMNLHFLNILKEIPHGKLEVDWTDGKVQMEDKRVYLTIEPK